MKTRLIQIGNSRGIRLPKAVIEQAGLADEVELHVQDGSVLITSTARPRRGWDEAAAAMAARGEARLLEPGTSTRFDEEEWVW